MPSGKILISSSRVPGRRVGLIIPTTPRHNVKLIGIFHIRNGQYKDDPQGYNAKARRSLAIEQRL